MRRAPRTRLQVEALEDRCVPTAHGVLVGTTLEVTGGPGNDRILLVPDASYANIQLYDGTRLAGSFAYAAVTDITVDAGGGSDLVYISPAILQPATLMGGAGDDTLAAGGGAATLEGGDGNDTLVSDMSGNNTLVPGSGKNKFFNVQPTDTIVGLGPKDIVMRDPPCNQIVTAADVNQLLQRAAAASASTDGIIAIVDRNGRILGVRVEGGVSPVITGDINKLTFAIDGAVAEARTAAFFANNQAPLTSRTVEFISQSTITQREVESSPEDPNPLFEGPGFVAPIGLGGHFPPNVPFTPPVDLFGIEHTNRDSIVHQITGDLLPARFNINPAFIPPGVALFPPESWGFQNGDPTAQSRGIGTLPGGIPLFKNGCLVGGIGVFFPGKTGYADAENSNLGVNYNPAAPDRAREAEWIAFAAAGGSVGAGEPIGSLSGVPRVPGYDLPFGRIDLVGITLPIYGPGGAQGPSAVVAIGNEVGRGNPNSGTNETVDGAVTARPGTIPNEGWLVLPHAGGGLTAADVLRIIEQGISEANKVRAAIRLPLESRTRMVFAVTDTAGDVLGLYRMPDATIFSEDVAVAKARNVSYYSDPAQLQPIDQLAGVPAGVAFTNRTFRYLAQPYFPSGQTGKPSGPFSILRDGGTDPTTGLMTRRLPNTAFQSAYGHDAFNPGTNFHDPNNIDNQNGVVWFPGSAPLYKNGAIVGGLGVSGDGVDQDDVVTFAASNGYYPQQNGVIRADQVMYGGLNLPYQKFLRNPLG